MHAKQAPQPSQRLRLMDKYIIANSVCQKQSKFGSTSYNPGRMGHETFDLLHAIDAALAIRKSLLNESSYSALRLFNGFTEGCPDLVVDLYARTLVVFDYSARPHSVEDWKFLFAWYQSQIPWLESGMLKSRASDDLALRRGVLCFGSHLADRICENGIWYALNLNMNQDASLYLDTRMLRAWLFENAASKDVLNTFAYTGSLGIAAAAGGAHKVISSDLNRRFLELARRSAQLNQIPENRHRLQIGDFFSQVASFKHSGTLFDIVISDPPFFSSTSKGQVQLVGQSRRIINKLRPLVRDGGFLISINNALFVSGTDYLNELNDLCKDGYLSLEEILPVPQDFIGRSTSAAVWPADPAPFNHPTKIAVLRVRRKTA